MRKFLVFAASVAVMVGCAKQYVDTPEVTGGASEIGFDTYVANSTKGLAKKDFVMGDQFFVYGGTTGSNNFDVAAPSFNDWVFPSPTYANDGAIVSNYGNNLWRYNNPVSWSAEKITFFGFSPVPTPTETYGITYASPADKTTIPSIDFVVKGGYDPATADAAAIAASRLLTKQQVDLLWVTTPDQTRANGTIAMMFKHALTRLNVSVRSQAPAGTRIRINTITLKKVIVDGTLSLAHDETKSGDLDYLGGWNTLGATKKDFAINLINSEASLITDNLIHNINDDDEALMMIPQPLTDVEMEVKYASSIDGVNWDNYETGVPVNVKLDQGGAFWNPNRQIRYVLNITPGEVIAFTATVEKWGDEESIELITKTVTSETQEVIKLDLKTGDKISTVKKEGWITYAEGVNLADDLTTEVEVPTDGTYTFAVKNNVLTTDRVDEIVIIHKDPATTTSSKSQTIVKVTQSKNNGIIKAPVGAGDVATFTLAAGDKITAIETKTFDATWVLVNGTVLSAEYATEGPAKISVTANTGAARKAALKITLNGAAVEYTIEQAGVETKSISAEEAGGKAHDGIAGDVITLINGGAWLTITEVGGVAAELSGTVTAGADYTLDVAANTGALRTASFTITSGGKTILYTLTQKARTAPTEVALTAIGGKAQGGVKDDVITLINGGGAWFTITDNGSVAIAVPGLSHTAEGVYTLDAGINLGVERTAEFSIESGGVTKSYKLTQAAATEVPKAIVAAGGEVFANVTIGGPGEYIEVLSGDATFTDGTGAAFSGKVTTAGTYTVKADMNTTTTEKTAKIAVVTASAVTIYNVTVAAATTVTLTEVLAAGGAYVEAIDLVAGDVIKGNGAASAWLSLASPLGTETADLSADVTVADAGAWVATAVEKLDADSRSENFTVVKADGSVVIYTASQAGI